MPTPVSVRSSPRCRPRWATPRSPDRPTLGGRAARLAALFGQPLMGWQAQVVNVALELDPATRLPAYRQVAVSVPRRSGKTTLFLAVQVDRSLGWGRRQRTLYAAQDRNNSRLKWEEQTALLRDSKLAG